jgi:MATE family multidrug resistance protein
MSGVCPNNLYLVHLQGLCLQISAMAYMASMAYSSSVNTRIGNELGAGDAATARLAFIIGVAAVILVQACITLGLFFGARQVLRLLTNNKEVDELARKVFPILLPTFIGTSCSEHL